MLIFSNLVENLVSQLPNPSNKHGVLSIAQYYNHSGLTKKFELLPTGKYYILKILRDIDTSKAAGIDRLPGRFRKDGADVLAKPVTDICNLAISLNKFPSAFKLVKVKPFLSFLKDKILKGFDNRVYTRMILIDLQKAFDTINHKILLDKLLPIGFSKNTISWYESYLAERHFTVEVANRVSKFSKISCGVPQGSILGPLLFLIYVNDMSQAVECDLYLYADDSCLLFQHKNVTEIKKQLTKDFSNICDWFVDNKLSIHFGEDKMKSILFSSKRNLKLVEEPDIRYKDRI